VRAPDDRILVLVGPTASGKTDVSIHLAEKLNGEIISADSRQVYRYLDIGTAKPTPDQLRKIRHYFINERDPDQPFTAGEFGAGGRRIIDDILARGKTPIVVGGSGLYVRSLVDGLFEGPPSDPELRSILEEKAKRGSVHDLLDELRGVDPEAAARADATKPRRIIRALEVYYLTGKPISRLHREATPEIAFRPLLAGLAWERKVLYERIERRCETMLAQGLEQEVDSLNKRGYDRRLNALNTVGYAEMFAFLNGEISRDKMIGLFKQNSRRYAKRQLTWFRADTRIQWIEMAEDRRADRVAAELAESFFNSEADSHPEIRAADPA
jgi:tRNA dimethylallyltransferase